MNRRIATASSGAQRSSAAARRTARQIESHADQAAALLKALANEQRLLILCNLLDGPLSVSDINARLELSQSALSQHLAVLRGANVVTTSRAGQMIRYGISAGVVLQIIEVLYRELCRK